MAAVVAPSGDVMFATSLGLSGHPSPPLSLPASIAAAPLSPLLSFFLSRQRQQSALFVITGAKIQPALSIKLPCHPLILKEFEKRWPRIQIQVCVVWTHTRKVCIVREGQNCNVCPFIYFSKMPLFILF